MLDAGRGGEVDDGAVRGLSLLLMTTSKLVGAVKKGFAPAADWKFDWDWESGVRWVVDTLLSLIHALDIRLACIVCILGEMSLRQSRSETVCVCVRIDL